MNYKKLLLIALSLIISMPAVDLRAEVNSLPFFAPTSEPLHSRIEEGWNFLLVGGGNFGNGRSRTAFISTGPWENGWISRAPWMEFGFSYAPSNQWGFGLEIPVFFTSTTLSAYYRATNFLKLGLKVGILSSLSTTFSVYPSDDWFVSLTPSASLLGFGIAQKHTVNTADFLSPPVYEQTQTARGTLNAQFAFGRHIDPLDLGFTVNYAYAFGNGLPVLFYFEEGYVKHFVRASVVLDF